MKKYKIITYGCLANYSDSERIEKKLKDKGYLASENPDLVIINICSIRQSAVDRAFAQAKKYKKVIVTGCLLDSDRDKFAKYAKIVKKEDCLKTKITHSCLVPIMTGCNNFCSYCVVPYTRGREYSRPQEEVIKETKSFIKNGAKEIWLLGQNVNSYKYDFPKLLKNINSIPGDFWIRFLSSHPKDMSRELIKSVKELPKVTEYINLAVQSGDNEILKKMNRKYTIEEYKKLALKIKKEIPNVCLSTDVIVGFPGETKNAFKNTLKLFKEIEFDMAYISKYSPRPGTLASKMDNQISFEEKTKRYNELNDLLKKISLKRNKQLVGQNTRVLINKNSIGKTREYKTIKVEGASDNSFVDVEITKALIWGLEGKIK
ncbi:MAG: MiaB/RimO family radical SAM methylthiotransferase [Candidatus Pacebacteria bacterium]|nr:MiaB/RimO family radical SAM methylthiotransferase [Candidatus Paceibacterota bacterium]